MSSLTFNFAADLASLIGGVVFDQSATGFSYTSGDGTSLFVTGRNLTYLDGLPSGGTITGMTLGLGVPAMAWSGLNVAASAYTAHAFTQPDAFALELLLLAGNDRIEGGAGNGMIHGRAGNDTLYGGFGDDWLFGDAGRDRYFGDDGTDGVTFQTLSPGGHGVHVNLNLATGQVRDDGFGNIETASGVERWEGSEFNDSLVGSGQAEVLWGAGGDDTLRGGGESDWLYGNAGNDAIFGDAGVDVLNGGRGVDRYDGGADGDILQLWIDEGSAMGVRVDFRRATGNILNDGFGHVETALRVETVEASERADWLHAGDLPTDQPLVLHGLAGDDTLLGGEAWSVLNGGAGNDLVRGGAGNESLSGGAGIDTLYGGAGRDMLDLYLPTFGLAQGVKVNLGLASGQVLDDGFGHVETIKGFELVSLSAQDDEARGSTQSDLFYGNDGDDLLQGAAGDDFLYGGGGDDSLQGGRDGDWLQGGAGANVMTGSHGADRFILELSTGLQEVTDFVSGLDYLILDADWLDFGGANSLTSDQLAFGVAASLGSHRVIYDQATGRLWVDADGSGAGQAQEIARLTNLVTLDVTDFGISPV